MQIHMGIPTPTGWTTAKAHKVWTEFRKLTAPASLLNHEIAIKQRYFTDDILRHVPNNTYMPEPIGRNFVISLSQPIANQ